MTIRKAIDELAVMSSKQQAQWAVSHVLGLGYTDLILSLDNNISFEEELEIKEIKRRLLNKEPIQYILGSMQFIDITIITDKRALIPRSETELLAQLALKAAQEFSHPQIVDIGSGTGCIGLFLKSRLENAQVELFDISDDALDLTRENAQALGLEVKTTKADMLKMDKAPCDVMVSNPPYIRSGDVNILDDKVKNFEPHTALFGGDDGLKFYRALVEIANKSISPNGTFFVETGYNLSGDVVRIFSKYFSNIKVVKDYEQIERIVVIKR